MCCCLSISPNAPRTLGLLILVRFERGSVRCESTQGFAGEGVVAMGGFVKAIANAPVATFRGAMADAGEFGAGAQQWCCAKARSAQHMWVPLENKKVLRAPAIRATRALR